MAHACLPASLAACFILKLFTHMPVFLTRPLDWEVVEPDLSLYLGRHPAHEACVTLYFLLIHAHTPCWFTHPCFFIPIPSAPGALTPYPLHVVELFSAFKPNTHSLLTHTSCRAPQSTRQDSEYLLVLEFFHPGLQSP